MLAAIAVAGVIYFKSRSTSHPQLTQSPASPSPAAQPGLPRAPASSTTRSEADATSLSELTRLTIQSLSSDDPALNEHAISRLLPTLVKRDVLAAARVGDLFVGSKLRPQILSVVARGWVDQNRAHALAWAQGLADTDERERVLVEILSRVAQTDPAAAVRLRQEITRDQWDDSELTNLAQRWAESDLGSVLGWIDSLPPGAQRDQLTARAAFIQSQNNPAEAAQLVMDRVPPGEAQTEALISVVHQWAQRDPDAASAWVESIPERLLRERAAQELEAASRARP